MNKEMINAAPRLKQIWSMLWGRLGSKKWILIVGLLFGLSQTVVMMLDPLIMNIYFNLLGSTNYESINLLIVISTVSFIFLVFVFLLGTYLKQSVISKLQADFILELADAAQRLPLERAQATHSSDLANRVSRDSGRTTGILTLLMDNIGEQLIMFILAAVYTFWLNWKIGMVILFISPIMLFASHLLRHRLQRIGLAVAEQEAAVRQWQQDAMQGMEIIRAYGIADWMSNRYMEERKRLNRLYMKRMWVNLIIKLVSSTYTNVMVLVSMLVIGWLAIHQSFAMGTMIAFFTLVWRINTPLQSIGIMWGQVQEATGASVLPSRCCIRPKNRP